MEKRLRSAVRSSAEEFLSAAVSDLSSKGSKSTLKSLIFAISPSSNLSSSLPSALFAALSKTIDSFKNELGSTSRSSGERSSRSPPSKRLRRRDEELGADEPETMIRMREIRRYVYISQLCVSSPKKSFNPAHFLSCVRSLHDCLVLFEADEDLSTEIASLCEKWWKEKLPERETLISQSLPFLLSRSLTLNMKSYVHRVYAMREAFLLFDFHDESIEDLKLLLLRCVITPLYLKTDEGRRFVAFMLSVNSKLLKESLALIKSQIQFGRKAVLEAYSEILFRFWKHSEQSQRREFEDGFLQYLVEGAIYASSKSLANSIRRILRGFFDNRAIDGVDKLLFRLAEPVLFRSLQVANSNVRQNALYLLIDLFPLENPDATREDKTILLERQSFLLEKLLEDDSPDIRSVSVEGCCRVLHHFWEVIPSSTITKMLTKIIDHISHDSSNDVKLSTLKGITYLLENPQALEVLKVLLPRLGFMFLDPFLSVRVHLCDLLLASRAIRNFQFTMVVDLDILLASLANDHPQVAKKIVTLLTPTYFPSKLAARDSCARFIVLIKRSPSAGARFCEFLPLNDGSSPKSLIELAKVCYTLATTSQDLSPSQIEALFTATANLCKELSTESQHKTTLSKFFTSDALKSLLPTVSSVRSQSSILRVVSSLHPEGLGDFRELCLNMMKNRDDQAEVRRIYEIMIRNGCSDDVFGAVADTLEMVRKKMGRTRKKKKKMRFDRGLAAMAARQVKDLLSGVETRRAVLGSPFLGSISSSLGVISKAVIESSDGLNEADDLVFVAAYAKLALFRSMENAPDEEGPNLEEILEGLLDSAEKVFGGADHDQRTARESPPVTRSRTKDTRPASSPSSPEGAEGPSDGTRLATLLLKFIADAATLSLIPATNPRWPAFASTALRHIIATSHPPGRRIPTAKYAFSYAAKLLHVIISHPVSPRTLSHLADNLLDLAAVAATTAITARPWLPDILLALASPHVGPGREGCHVANDGSSHVSLWVRAMDGDRGPTEVVRAAAVLLRKDGAVAAAVAAAAAEKVKAAVEVGDFGAILGLVQWVCVDVGGPPTCGFVEEVRACVDCAFESLLDEQKEEKRLLENARALLEGRRL
ncbi:ARM repeat superfamily protein [Wolffia australiana]